MTIMQKAVTPAQSEAIRTSGYDRVAGYTVRQSDAEAAVRPEEIRALHGLDDAGAPFAADHVDVLVFPVAPSMQFEDAVGGTTREEQQATGGAFLEHPPFRGTGFAPVERPVPLWWLAPTRVSPGTRLVRFDSTGTSQLLAEYGDVATGWLVPGATGRLPASPSLYVGTLAAVDGGYRACDLVDDRVILFEPSDGSRRELARREVGAIFELAYFGVWNGLDVRLVERWNDGEEALARCVSLTHDVELAEALGMERVEAGVYEATVPEARVAALRTVRLDVDA